MQQLGIKLQYRIDQNKTGNIYAPVGRQFAVDENDEYEVDQGDNPAMNTVGAIASSEGGNFSSDDDGHIFAGAEIESEGSDLSELEVGGAVASNMALVQAERNRAFYNELDKRMDLLIREIVKP